MSIGSDNFYTSERVNREAVSFPNQYQMKVAGNLFIPKDLQPEQKAAALVIGHPMGAVKEQAANLYATKMAEAGFVTLSLDLSFWGESEGRTRNMVSPDIYAEDFSAAVDFLRTCAQVDGERIGGIGICGSGGFILSAAKIDSRLKAVATVSMYDMGEATRRGLGGSISNEMRKQMVEEASLQRDVEFRGGETRLTGGCPHEVDENSHPIAKEFYDFYHTPRGEYTPSTTTAACTTHPTLSSNVKFLNFYPFNDLASIAPRPLLFIAGENAHSYEFSEQAYKQAGQPKELLTVPGVGHVDLYDGVNVIPWERLTAFFSANLG